MEKRRKEILEGSIPRTLVVLSVPLIIGQMIQVLNNLIDTFWLGRLGRVAVSAPTMSWPLLAPLFFLAGGLLMGGMSLISRLAGAGRGKDLEVVIPNFLYLMVLAGVLVFAVVFPIFPLLFRALSTPESIMGAVKVYFGTVALGIPFLFAGMGANTVLRALGDTYTPFYINLASVLLNLLLDPILIFGFSLGVEGAAIATTLANIFLSVSAIYVLIRRSLLKIVKIDRSIWKGLLGIGGPTALGNLLTGLHISVIMKIVASFGVVAVAAYGIGARLLSFINTLIFGVSGGNSIVLGQNVGKGNIERARRSLWITTGGLILVMGALAILLFLWAEPVYRLFIEDPAVVRVGTQFLRIYVWSVVFFALFLPTIRALKVVGKAKLAAGIDILRTWGIRVPLVYLLSVFMGLAGVWWGLLLESAFEGILGLYFLVKSDWLKEGIISASS